ncbi:MAG: hypothetical protein JST11_07245 [Acidobacteria bacterium]|nr:hypothetical protein [Acidobacteriota bacterium]
MRSRTTALPLTLLPIAALAFAGISCTRAGGGNLISDPSFETVHGRDRAGLMFPGWSGRYEGGCSFDAGSVAHTGNTSALLTCISPGRIRLWQLKDLDPGRYRISAYIRGLEIAAGTSAPDPEFTFVGKSIPLNRSGNFGWTHLTYVADVVAKGQAGPSFALSAPGYLWIDDVSMARVAPDTPLSATPVLDREERPIEAPGPLTAGAVHCPRCGYRNLPRWGRCYACGSPLESSAGSSAGPPVKTIASFEDGNPFEGGVVVTAHATGGVRALRIDKDYAAMRSPQNWQGYDSLAANVFVPGARPIPLGIEINDTATRDYWTRVNYQTLVPPGASTLTIPLQQLYVGEKSKPGRRLILDGIRRLVFNVGDNGPLFLDNLRLERDSSARGFAFDGLQAFDFGPAASPVMDGFTPVTPATQYSPGRGYGLQHAAIWQAMDALQPDPLYQDFLCITSGHFLVDVPNGRYRVFLNLDSPSAYWGDYQVYRTRTVKAQGKVAVSEHMDFAAFLRRYFRFWDTEDLPSDDTFDKYDPAHFSAKVFDVEVTQGRIDLEFQGERWADSVSAIVIFPLDKAAEGTRFLEHVKARRRFYFDNAFKRVLHEPGGAPGQPRGEDAGRGYVVFQRDFMEDVYYNDAPRPGELRGSLEADAFAGENVPLTMSVLPLKDLGMGTLEVSALTGSGGTIPPSAIDVGYVSYRVTRVTTDGAVYTIAPRWIVPNHTVRLPRGVTRRFWMTVRVPPGASPGIYSGQARFTSEHGAAVSLPVRFTVRKGALDAVDIPAGPFGGAISVPWFGDDPAARAFDEKLTAKSLAALRASGFTMFTGVPSIAYRGFRNGAPLLDFVAADREMEEAAKYGFKAVSSYGAGVIGLDPYRRDLAAMKQAGFSDYSAFVKAVYAEIDRHARQKGWLPVYWNLGDEPDAGALQESIANARAYRDAFPGGVPAFTLATSLPADEQSGPRFELARAVTVAALNLHDATGVEQLTRAGGAWAFYNQGNRWTFGNYMYKAAKEYGMMFRLAWHWNIVAGDPYYALDCREDDYAWANSTPDGRLVPWVGFYRNAAGLSDYRYLLTLARLAREKAGTPAATHATELIRSRMASFPLGRTEPGAGFLAEGWQSYRRSLADAIVALSR